MNIVFRDIRLTPMSNDTVLQQWLRSISIQNVGTRENVPFAGVYHNLGQQILRCDKYMDGMSLPPIIFTPRK
jgi:hypothetical protein